MKDLTADGVASQSASEIPAGGVLITGGLCLRCNRESSCCQGFGWANVRSEPSHPLNGNKNFKLIFLRCKGAFDNSVIPAIALARHAARDLLFGKVGLSRRTTKMQPSLQVTLRQGYPFQARLPNAISLAPTSAAVSEVLPMSTIDCSMRRSTRAARSKT